MKFVVPILMIVAAVYAVDEDPGKNGEADIVRDPFCQWLEGIRELEEQIQEERDEVDSKGIVKEAFDSVVARRTKRSWDERKEKKRLIEIDALIEKLWADREKQANSEAADTPVTEQEEQYDTEPEAKASRRNGPRPRFESSSEYPHDRRKSERRNHERKEAKMDEPKRPNHEEGEEGSGEDFIHEDKADDTEGVPDVADEVKDRRLEKLKKVFRKNQGKEESGEDHSIESINEHGEADSDAIDQENSSSAIPRKIAGLIELDLVESELATDAPQEYFVSDPASPDLPASVVPATAASADLKHTTSDDAASEDPTRIAFDDVDSADTQLIASNDANSMDSDPIATAGPVLAASGDPVTDALAEPIPDTSVDPISDASADSFSATPADPISIASEDLVHVVSLDSDPVTTDEMKGEEKKLKSEMKDEQTTIKANEDISEKAQKSATHARIEALMPVEQQVRVPLTRGLGKTELRDMKQAKIQWRKYNSQSAAITSPKNGKTKAKKPSSSATRNVTNEEKTLAASEDDTAV